MKADSYLITLDGDGVQFVAESGQTILDACQNAGIWVPSECCHGVCGACKISVKSGSVDMGLVSHIALSDLERDAGIVLACKARVQSDLRIAIEAENSALPYFKPKTVTAVVTENEPMAKDTNRLRLTLDEAFEFDAGQYLQLEIPGCGWSRDYSMASSPFDPLNLELHFARKSGSQTSTSLGRLKVGDGLTFKGPFGQFRKRDLAARHVLYLAGGTGLSAIQSMLLANSDFDESVQATLIHGVATPEHAYALDLSGAAAGSNLRIITVVENVDQIYGWSGAVGQVHDVLADVLTELPVDDLLAYICGAPEMVEYCIQTLGVFGVADERMIYERFFTADEPR